MNGRISPHPDNLNSKTFCHLGGYKSKGEELVYYLLREILKREEWYVLYSYQIPDNHHINKPEGSDIDFLIIDKKLGFICLEVKSSLVKYEDQLFLNKNRKKGNWKQIDSPFEQIKSNKESLRSMINQSENYLFSWLVVFPETLTFKHKEFNESSIILSSDMNPDAFIEKIKKRANYNKKIYNRKYPNIMFSTMNNKEINTIFNILRHRKSKEGIDRIELNPAVIQNELNNLTNKQIEILNKLSSNNLLVKGSAGSGKTIIAIESFIRAKEKGEKVLFICYSKLLAFYVNSIISKQIKIQENEIISLQEILELKDENISISNVDYILDNLETDYTYIVIDEFQDLLNIDEIMNLIAVILRNDINTRGTWAFFGDMDNQQTINKIDFNALFKDINYAEYQLDINCRNTKEINDYLKKRTRFKNLVKSNNIKGEVIEMIAYENDDDKNQKLKEIIHMQINEIGHREYNITILSNIPYKKQKFKINREICNLNKKPFFFINKKGIGYSSIDNFKGLENNIIILYDIPTNGLYLNKLYVALSRAIYKLYIFNNKDNVKEFQEHYAG